MDVESTPCLVGQSRSLAADRRKPMCGTRFRRSFTPLPNAVWQWSAPTRQRQSGRPDPGDHRSAYGEAAR